MPVKLVRPTVDYQTSYVEAVREFKVDGHHRYIEANPDELNAGFPAFIQGELGKEQMPPFPNAVTETVYWLVDDKDFLGRISLRHELNDFLKTFGGHIGYEVRPTHRKQGHATEMLRLVLIEAHKCGMKKVMLTCDDDNIGSQKVIQKNGGVLQDVVKLDFRDVPTMRWWITLEEE